MYDGDPGQGGEYVFYQPCKGSRCIIPANVSAEIRAHSLKGSSDGEPPPTGGTLKGEKKVSLKQESSAALYLCCLFQGQDHLKRP